MISRLGTVAPLLRDPAIVQPFAKAPLQNSLGQSYLSNQSLLEEGPSIFWSLRRKRAYRTYKSKCTAQENSLTFHIDKTMMTLFYRTLIESILSFSLVSLFINLSLKNRNSLSQMVKSPDWGVTV